MGSILRQFMSFTFENPIKNIQSCALFIMLGLKLNIARVYYKYQIFTLRNMLDTPIIDTMHFKDRKGAYINILCLCLLI